MAKGVSAMVTVAWAVQKEVFIVLNPRFAEAHRTRTLKKFQEQSSVVYKLE